MGYVYAEGGGEGLYAGAMRKAAQAFEGATTIVPHFAEAYTYWGNALQEMGEMGEAAAVFDEAIGKFVKGKGKGLSHMPHLRAPRVRLVCQRARDSEAAACRCTCLPCHLIAVDVCIRVLDLFPCTPHAPQAGAC